MSKSYYAVVAYGHHPLLDRYFRSFDAARRALFREEERSAELRSSGRIHVYPTIEQARNASRNDYQP